MLTLHQGNRLEALAERLARVTRVPLTAPLAAETIVVQSHGVARWLALELARSGGICANVRFPLPAAYAWKLYRALDALPHTSDFEVEVMTWRIMQELPALEVRAAFAPVRAYVRGETYRRYELARRIADTFDQYLLYRPDWIAQWDAGDTPHWQALLWRRVVAGAGTPHRAALHRRFLERLDGALVAQAGVPERISVFGAPALPPMLLELLAGLAEHVDVHLFLLNPCREYWGDIEAGGAIARSKLAGRPDAAYLESGNALLASLGKQGRDFFDLLQNCAAVEDDCYVDPGSASLLAAVQSDILELRERATAGGAVEVAAEDRSLQVHACHGAMREVEVLHDQLLALFERWPDLEPSDIVVMTPDIESFAPYIDAVFGTAEPRIPFSVSDRSAERESPLAATFMALLDLPGSRYEAAQVLELLDEPAVRRRFALTLEDLDTVRDWVRESGIRWGIDSAHRAHFGVPATFEHTWRFGLERLLLGYALPGGGERLFGDALPHDEVEGSLGEVLGRFADFAEAAIALNGMPATRSVPQWGRAVREILGQFFDPGEGGEEEIAGLRAALSAFESEAAAGGFEGAIPLEVVKRALRSRLEIPGRAFLSGGVTFCAMVPMRSLPFEIVCLIGMNDTAFPRMRRPYGFDLMASDFRKGDRSRRDDDRYLFLESLTSARRCFYMSYTGRHIRDDSVMPPSVLVSELMDYLAQNYSGAQGSDVRAQVQTQHPLQPFSVRYFTGDPRLFSYSRTLCEAAGRSAGEAAPQPFIAQPLPEPESEWRVVELESLIRFLRNPARYFLRERLGIRLEEAEEDMDGREPLVLGGLEDYALKQRLLGVRMRGVPLAGALPVARASGLLPHAQVGTAAFERTANEVEGFAQRLLAAHPRHTPEPIPFDLQLAGMELRGVLSGVSGVGLLGHRLAECKAKDLLDAWVRHLVLNVLRPEGVTLRTRWFLQDKVLEFSPLAEPHSPLAALLSLYWCGLQRPLHFLPESACAYLKKERSIDAARKVWFSNHNRGEDADPYYRLAFRGVDALGGEFEALAQAVFGPLLAAMEERRPA
ncbi:MAG: exodeoxyribonuclease V subunit gamma [Betaproteobacteria bacterium]